MRELTVFVYLAGDSCLMGLDDKAKSLVASIWDVRCPESCAVVVGWDRLSAVSSECGMSGFSLSGETRESWLSGAVNSASPEVLLHFLQSGAERFPSKRSVLIIIGHSDGFLGLCCDDGAEDEMTVPALAGALKGLAGKTGPAVDVVVLDCCWMAMAEVALELSECCTVLMASQDEALHFGIPVREVLAGLFESAVEDAFWMASSILRTVACTRPSASSDALDSVTPQFSAILPSRIPALADCFSRLSHQILILESSGIGELHRIRYRIWHSGNYAVRVEPYTSFCDMGHFLEQLIDSDTMPDSVRRAASASASRLEESVMGAVWSGNLMSGSRGLSFFFPKARCAGEVMELYTELRWPRESGWLDALRKINGESS